MWIHLLTLKLIKGASEATSELVGRNRHRRRRRIFNSTLAQVDIPSAKDVAKEKALVEQMLAQAELDQLIDETKILRGALDVAAKRQQKAINTMLASIHRRIDDIQEDDDLITLLIGD